MGIRTLPFFKSKKGFQFAGGGNVDKFDDLPVATTTSIGCVKADGTTINVNSSGKISTTALLKKYAMPEASASELNNIYMYTGADTASFTSGHVYKCVSDEDPDTPTYSWEPVELEDPYTLPKATDSTLGGIKVSENVGFTVANNGTIKLSSIFSSDTTTVSIPIVLSSLPTYTSINVMIFGGGGSETFAFIEPITIFAFLQSNSEWVVLCSNSSLQVSFDSVNSAIKIENLPKPYITINYLLWQSK